MNEQSKDTRLSERLGFIGIDQRTRQTLKDLKPVVAEAIVPALAKFYDKVRATPETGRFFSDAQHMASASGRQQQHRDIIMSAGFGQDYANAIRSIGATHARIGLEPRWYIGGYPSSSRSSSRRS